MPTTTKKTSKTLFLIGEIETPQVAYLLREIIDTDWSKINHLKLYITSPGGDLHSTFGIIDLIEEKQKHHKFKVTTYALGVAGSGGFFLFLLGSERLMYSKCRIFVHEHYCADIEELPFTLQELSHEEDKALNTMYTSWVSKRLGIDFKKAKELLILNKWLNKKEIAEYNIITGTLNE